MSFVCERSDIRLISCIKGLFCDRTSFTAWDEPPEDSEPKPRVGCLSAGIEKKAVVAFLGWPMRSLIFFS